jgi:thiol-disulfide isomerase/thioredoxin
MLRSPIQFLLPAVALLSLSCAAPQRTVAPPEPMVLGPVDRSFISRPENRAFAVTYDTVQVSGDVVELIRMAQADAEFLVFFGSWCGDSKLELPRFMKIADLAGIPADRIRLHGLDRAKKSADGFADGYDIVRVPTFIVFRAGKEEGRIVEHPVGTLEGDLLTILARPQNR